MSLFELIIRNLCAHVKKFVFHMFTSKILCFHNQNYRLSGPPFQSFKFMPHCLFDCSFMRSILESYESRFVQTLFQNSICVHFQTLRRSRPQNFLLNKFGKKSILVQVIQQFSCVHNETFVFSCPLVQSYADFGAFTPTLSWNHV